jgi:hypothetical protein
MKTTIKKLRRKVLSSDHLHRRLRESLFWPFARSTRQTTTTTTNNKKKKKKKKKGTKETS